MLARLGAPLLFALAACRSASPPAAEADSRFTEDALRASFAALLPLLLFAASLLAPGPAESEYEKDVHFALEEIEKRCGHFFALKAIDWKKVSAEMTKAAKAVKSPEEHLLLLTRLVARLKDGHAQVRPLEKGAGIREPEELAGGRESPGMFLCRIGRDFYVKTAFGAAAAGGVKPGDKLVKVNGKSADAWMAERVAALAELRSFSTEQHAFFFACHGGLYEQKETIELPSRLFSLFVSVGSNKGRFNGGKGIEGIGVIPHETLEFKPRDLAEGKDTLILRAEAILRDFPSADVPYDPKAFGWAK